MWILLAILSSLCWAIVNVIDKFVLSKWVKRPLTPTIILGLVSLLAALYVFIFKDVAHLSKLNILLALAAGVFYILMTIFYFKALFDEEVSRITPLFYLAPLFILIFAWLFLGESLSAGKIFGVILLVVGAMLISSRDALRPKFSKALGWMVLSALALAANQLLTKYLLNQSDFYTVFFYLRIGAVVSVLPILYFNFDDLKATARRHGARSLLFISSSELLNLLGSILITLAVAAGSVTLVNALSSIQPFFVLVIVLIIGFFLPKILKEENDKITLIQKFAAIAAMFAGALLIT